jgi:hypothetical protein
VIELESPNEEGVLKPDRAANAIPGLALTQWAEAKRERAIDALRRRLEAEVAKECLSRARRASRGAGRLSQAARSREASDPD